MQNGPDPMAWGDATSTVVQALTGMALLVGLVGGLATLTQGERLRRRLKVHTEVLSTLPDGDDAGRMRQIVSLDVLALHDLTFPNPRSETRRLRGIADWWILPTFLVGMVGVIWQELLGGTIEGRWGVAYFVFAGVAGAGLGVSYVRWRRAQRLNAAAIEAATTPEA